jgi:hypothetical protein
MLDATTSLIFFEHDVIVGVGSLAYDVDEPPERRMANS